MGSEVEFSDLSMHVRDRTHRPKLEIVMGISLASPSVQTVNGSWEIR